MSSCGYWAMLARRSRDDSRCAGTSGVEQGEELVKTQIKNGLKRGALIAATITVSPFILLSRCGHLLGEDSLFTTLGQFLALVPGRPGSFMRLAYYRGTLQEVARDVCIGFGTFFSQPTASIGRNVSIGDYCIIGTATLGDNVLLGSRVSITSGKRQHSQRFDAEHRSEQTVFDRVCIGRDTWIGEGAVVMASVGAGSIVSAGGIVTREMPGNRLIAGNPARIVQDILEERAVQGESSGQGILPHDGGMAGA